MALHRVNSNVDLLPAGRPYGPTPGILASPRSSIHLQLLDNLQEGPGVCLQITMDQLGRILACALALRSLGVGWKADNVI